MKLVINKTSFPFNILEENSVILVDYIFDFKIRTKQKIITFLFPNNESFFLNRRKNYNAKDLTKIKNEYKFQNLSHSIIHEVNNTSVNEMIYILINTAGLDWMDINLLIDFVIQKKNKSLKLILFMSEEAISKYDNPIPLKKIKI